MIFIVLFSSLSLSLSLSLSIKKNLLCSFVITEIASFWEQEWDWSSYENRKDIKKEEWKHVRWFYDNCNWRRGCSGNTFAVTSTNNGAPIGVAFNPCETLYKLLKVVREYKEQEKKENEKEEQEWEKVYTRFVKRKDQVQRKGKKERKKPNIVNW